RSGGIPRLINVIADRALMAGYAREQQSIGERLVDRSADETLPGHARYWVRRYARWVLATLLVLAVIVFGIRSMPHETAPEDPTKVVAPALPAPPDVRIDPLEARLAAPPETELSALSQLLTRWQIGSGEVS